MGQSQIIELLISESYGADVPSHTFCYEAREMVDDIATDALAAAIKAKTKAAAGAAGAAGGGGSNNGQQAKTSCWRSSSRAKQAAKALIEVALECVAAVSARSTPAQVLPKLEAAAGAGGQQGGFGWLG